MLISINTEIQYFVLECPYCHLYKKADIGCGIFRHATNENFQYVDPHATNENFHCVDPHASKEKCEQLINSGKIIGCCKLFKVVVTGETATVEMCDYIYSGMIVVFGSSSFNLSGKIITLRWVFGHK